MHPGAPRSFPFQRRANGDGRSDVLVERWSAKQAIVTFVRETTNPDGSKFVPPKADREGGAPEVHPVGGAVVVKAKPELGEVEPLKTVMSGNREAMAKFTLEDLDRDGHRDVGAGKPESIHLMIGRRSCAAFGNSTGDRQILEYTKAGDRARLAMLVLHDDAEGE
jgi:hypothetical protein